MNVTSLVSSLIVSGSFGYLNYLILDKLGEVNFNKNTKDEKAMILLLFSALNYSLYLIIGSFSWFQGAQTGDYKSIAIIIFLIALIDIIGTIYICAPLIVKFNEKINNIREKKHKGPLDSIGNREDFFESDKIQCIYIYDFSNHLISCGYYNYDSPSIGEYFDISLGSFYSTNEEQVEYSKVLQSAEETDGSKVFIDFEKKIKIYNIPQNLK